jgi:tRNA A37 threonylcarbamoyladenosine biosynthesis protein TsaE
LLDREQQISVLTSVIKAIDGPCVLGIDGPWRSGKTTFLRMWAQHLRNESFPVVSFNAWETDFSGDTFLGSVDISL